MNILKYFSNSIKFKLFASTLLVVGIATILVSLGIYSTVLSDLQESLGLRLKHIASTASLLVNEDDHQKIYLQYVKGVKGSEIAKSDSFKSVQKTLRSIKKVNNLKQDIYTVVLPKWLKKNKQMLFMAMSNEKPYVGNGLERSEIASEVFEKKEPKFSKIYTDSEGKWISALAPIFKVSKKTGKKRVIALIEVDYDVTDEVAEVQMKLLKKTLVWSAVGLLLSFIITYFVSNALSSPIVQLTLHTKKNIDDDWVSSLKIDRNDEIGTLASSMKSMVSEIIVSRKQLEDYAQNLEQKVRERTKELNDMNIKLTCILDSLGQGLFLINNDASIDPLYAKKTDSFLAKPLNSMNLSDFYIEEFDINRTFNILFKEMIPFEDGLELLPKEINKKSQDMYLDVTYKTIMTDEGIDKILVVITDKTFEVLSERRFKAKELETNRFLSIFGSQRELKSFLGDAKERLLEAREVLSKETLDFFSIKGHAHTIKGGGSWFYAEGIIRVSSEIEKLCLDSKSEGANLNEVRIDLTDKLNELESEIKEFSLFSSEVLGYDVEGDDIISIKEGDVFSLIKEFQDTEQKKLFDRLLCEDAGNILSGFNNPLQDMSKRLKKKVNKILVSSDGTRIYRKQYSDLLDTLIHYIRNIAVHGIESEDIRVKRNKSRFAEVAFSVKKNNDKLLFSFKDDGNGIDPKLITVKCNELGVKVSGMSDHEIVQNVFLEKVSTTEEKDDWSGLGVGLDVIKSTVTSMGGKIEIFSDYEKGTELVIEMPFLEYEGLSDVAN